MKRWKSLLVLVNALAVAVALLECAGCGGSYAGVQSSGVPCSAAMRAVGSRDCTAPPTSPNSASTACLSNLKQIGLGTLMYAQDYDQTLPFSGVRQIHQDYTCFEGNSNVSTSKTWEEWEELLIPYLRTVSVFTCPALTNHPCHGYTTNNESEDDDYPGAPSPPFEFAQNVQDGSGNVPQVTIGQIVAPNQCIFINDSPDRAVFENGQYTTWDALHGAGPAGVPDTNGEENVDRTWHFVQGGQVTEAVLESTFPIGPWRHSGMMNVLFADGHVASEKFNQIPISSWNIQNMVPSASNDPSFPND